MLDGLALPSWTDKDLKTTGSLFFLWWCKLLPTEPMDLISTVLLAPLVPPNRGTHIIIETFGHIKTKHCIGWYRLDAWATALTRISLPALESNFSCQPWILISDGSRDPGSPAGPLNEHQPSRDSSRAERSALMGRKPTWARKSRPTGRSKEQGSRSRVRGRSFSRSTPNPAEGSDWILDSTIHVALSPTKGIKDHSYITCWQDQCGWARWIRTDVTVKTAVRVNHDQKLFTSSFLHYW